MLGQATVTIKDDQWSAWVASTPTELTTGLSGRESIPAGTGMLFVLPAKQPVTIDTSGMLFPIDVVFISENLVIDVASDIEPGYLVTEETPCDMFLEVNAGEAAGVEVGDAVTTVVIQQPRFDLRQIISFAIPAVVLGFVCGMVGGVAGLMGGSSSSPKRGELSQVEKVTVKCPICGDEIEVPEYDRVTRSEALRGHIEREHRGEKLLPQTGKVYFIGFCKVSEGMCLTHNNSVSETVKCPNSPLTEEEWKATYELVKIAFPGGQPNPWVNGWWPESWEEAVGAIENYKDSLWDAYRKYEAMTHKALEHYYRSAGKAIEHYREYVMREYERGREFAHEKVAVAKVIPTEKRPRRESDLEYLADSPEFLTQTIEAIGYRDKLDTTFQEAIRRAKRLK